MDSKQSKSHLTLIFITIFLYLVGFGIMIPIMPIISREFGASPFTVGLLMSAYSIMQFVFAPLWGRFSDRYGRRPVLIFCLVGEAISYFIFALSQTLTGLFIARILAGFFGASISTASASISDATPKAERSRGMALVGAAFGLGFMVGPAVGGGLALLGEAWFPQLGPSFGMKFASAAVGVLCLMTASFAGWKLKETVHLSRQKKSQSQQINRFARLGLYLRKPLIGPLIGNYFLNSLALSLMEATLILFTADRFSWTIKEVSFGFAYIGILSTLNQGFLVRKLLPVWGERTLIKIGFSLQALGFLLIATSHSISWLAVAMTIFSLGNGFVNPSLLGSISVLAEQDEQGEALGTTQGTASLGRIFGPALGGLAYGYIGLTSPFFISMLIALLALAITFKLSAHLPESAKAPQKFDEIGYFQFSNLIQGRVNFILLHDSINFNEHFGSLELAHIQRIQLTISFDEDPEKWVTALKAHGFPPNVPVVIVKNHGPISKAKINKLSQFYTGNICVVTQDWPSLKLEARNI